MMTSLEDTGPPQALNEKQFRSFYGYRLHVKKSALNNLKLQSLLPTRRTLFRIFPILTWLPNYKVKEWLFPDCISGLTVGVLQIPQGMAYSSLAGLPPVYGLYTGFFPVLPYTVFGTSRHLSVGSYALTSLMIGAYLETKIPIPDNTRQNENSTSLLNTVYHERLLYANAITFFASLILMLFSFLHLGSATRLFARPVQSGFVFAIALLTSLSQVKSLIGVSVGSYSGPLFSIKILRDIVIAVTSLTTEGLWHTTASIVTSLICIIFLITIKIINQKYRKKFPLNIPLPGEMLVVLFGTLISWAADLEHNYHVYVVGFLPRGLPEPKIPKTDVVGAILVQSILIAVIGYSVAISLAQNFAEKGGYKIRPNQELLAFGICNFFGSFFSCIPSFSAMSRSCVQFETGGKTQLVGWLSSILMLLVLMFIGPVFQYLPKACLASIVVVSVSGLLRNIYEVKRYWNNHKLDAVTWAATCCATLLLDVSLGLVIGIAVLLICSLLNTSLIKMHKLQRVASTEIYRQEGLYDKAVATDSHVTLVQFHGPLNFFSSTTFRKSLIVKSGIDPALHLEKLDEIKRQKVKLEEEEPTKADVGNNSSPSNEIPGHVEMPFVGQREEEHGNSSSSKRMIVLDCSGIASIDSVGSNTLIKVIVDYKTVDTEVFLASCSENLLQCLSSNDDFDVTDIAYVTVHEAMEAATRLINCENNIDDSETSL